MGARHQLHDEVLCRPVIPGACGYKVQIGCYQLTVKPYTERAICCCAVCVFEDDFGRLWIVNNNCPLDIAVINIVIIDVACTIKSRVIRFDFSSKNAGFFSLIDTASGCIR